MRPESGRPRNSAEYKSWVFTAGPRDVPACYRGIIGSHSSKRFRGGVMGNQYLLGPEYRYSSGRTRRQRQFSWLATIIFWPAKLPIRFVRRARDKNEKCQSATISRLYRNDVSRVSGEKLAISLPLSLLQCLVGLHNRERNYSAMEGSGRFTRRFLPRAMPFLGRRILKIGGGGRARISLRDESCGRKIEFGS